MYYIEHHERKILVLFLKSYVFPLFNGSSYFEVKKPEAVCEHAVAGWTERRGSSWRETEEKRNEDGIRRDSEQKKKKKKKTKKKKKKRKKQHDGVSLFSSAGVVSPTGFRLSEVCCGRPAPSVSENRSGQVSHVAPCEYRLELCADSGEISSCMYNNTETCVCIYSSGWRTPCSAETFFFAPVFLHLPHFFFFR